MMEDALIILYITVVPLILAALAALVIRHNGDN